MFSTKKTTLRSWLKPKGFTLIEVLAVVAIISVLAALALPAYNRYTTKSRFTEVVAATNPIKSFIAACAGSGDCVSNGQLYLNYGSPAVAGVIGWAAGTADNPWGVTDVNTQNMLGFIYSALLYENSIGNTSFGPATQANTFALLSSLLLTGASYSAWNDTSTSNGSGGYTNGCVASYVYVNSSPVFTCLSIPVTVGNPTLYLPTSYPYTYLYQHLYSTISTGTPIAAVAAVTAASAVAATISAPCVGSGAGCSPPTKYVLSASADSSGLITATAQSNWGLNNETYVLMPSYSSGRVDWSVSGSCATRSGGKLC